MRIEQRFGLIIRQLRIKKGLSQEKLALDADIDRTYIGDKDSENNRVFYENNLQQIKCLPKFDVK